MSASGPAESVLVIDERWRSPREGQFVLASAALGRPARVNVLTPRRAVAAAPPLLLLLHGADADPDCWESGVGISARARELEAVVVMPEGGAVGFCTDWVRAERPVPGRIGRAGGRRVQVAPAWERFHLDEVLPWAHARFATSGCRVVLGVSMGGLGAIAYTARRPGTFVAAASLSGILDLFAQGIPALTVGALLREQQHPYALWGSPRADRRRWEAHDPLTLAARLDGVPLYLARADGRPAPGDPESPRLAGALERLIGPCTDSFSRRLNALGIRTTVHHGRGVHMWPTWNRELDRAWPFLTAALGLRDAHGGLGGA
jgi:diacylglycerol O-acyltransferase/trehalose O-mycolyltransferase